MHFLTHPFTDDLREMNRLMTRVFGSSDTARNNSDRTDLTLSAAWTPSVDIEEADNAYLVRIEIPQVKKDDVKITVDDGVLVVTGERKQATEDKNRRYHRVERSYGAFYRSFRLPNDVDPAKIDAKFADGMLNVTLPRESAKPHPVKEIAVQ